MHLEYTVIELNIPYSSRVSEMASFCSSFMIGLALLVLVFGGANATLYTNFYTSSCPKLFDTVKCEVESALSKETRMGASLLRLFFHDCFVNVIF